MDTFTLWSLLLSPALSAVLLFILSGEGIFGFCLIPSTCGFQIYPLNIYIFMMLYLFCSTRTAKYFYIWIPQWLKFCYGLWINQHIPEISSSLNLFHGRNLIIRKLKPSQISPSTSTLSTSNQSPAPLIFLLNISGITLYVGTCISPSTLRGWGRNTANSSLGSITIQQNFVLNFF